MRVLFSSTPGFGHVHPMVPLAVALRDRGDDVRWAVAADACPRIEAAGLMAVPAGLAQVARIGEYRRRYPEMATLAPEDRPAHMFPRLFGEIGAPAMLADLLPFVREWRPELVVHDAAELAAPIAATLVGAPHVTHGFGPLLPRERMPATEPYVEDLWRAHGLEPRPYCGVYDDLYLDIYPPSMRPDDAGHVPRRQALRPLPYDERHDEWPEWIARRTDRPLVYVTFGTVFNNDSTVFRAAVAGVAGFDVDVVATVGPKGDPAMLGDMPDNVRVERYIPQTALLPHCALVVSHAGSGTVLASLSGGLPQLCLPQAADQFLNARQVAAAGAGLALHPHAADVASIAAAVGRLLSEPAFRDAADGISREIAAMPGPDEVAGVVERLVG